MRGDASRANILRGALPFIGGATSPEVDSRFRLPLATG